MKTRIFCGVLVCLFLSSCASKQVWLKGPLNNLMYVKQWTEPLGQQRDTIDGIAYDRVWDACEQTLIKLGYSFFVADKEAGEIVVRRDETVSVSVVRNDEKISVLVGLLVSKTKNKLMSPLLQSDKDVVDIIMARLQKELKLSKIKYSGNDQPRASIMYLR